MGSALTPPREARDYRGFSTSPSTCRRVALVAILTLAAPAVRGEPRADTGPSGEDPVARLIRRALVRAGLEGDDRLVARATRSVLWPSLRIGAAARRPDRGTTTDRWDVTAALEWPLGRTPLGEPGRTGRQRAERRAEIAERVADLWRSRQQLATPSGDPRVDVFERLRAEEIEDELEALTGEPPACAVGEDCP